MADGPESTKKTTQSYNDYNNASPVYDKVKSIAKKILGMSDTDDEEKKKKKPPATVIEALSEPFK